MTKNNITQYILFVVLAAILTLGMVGCTGQENKPSITKTVTTDTNLASYSTTQALKKFSSVTELKEFLKNAQANSGYGGTYYYGGGMMRNTGMAEGGTMVKAAAAPVAMDSSSESIGSSQTAVDYSQTNVQVEGVDEADFVKNDGKYIYILSQEKLVIIDAYPADNADVISETELKGYPQNMFVNGDRLVVFTNDNEEAYVLEEYDYMPRPRYAQITHAYVYDVSDRKDPKLVKDYNLKGYYYDARMIGDYVYFIVQEGVNYYNNFVDVPVLKESATRLITPDIYYFDNPEDNYNFNTVASFDIQSDDNDINAKTFMMGYANNLYVSEKNIYITYQKNLPYLYYRGHNEERFYDVVVPLLPDDAQQEIEDIKDDGSLTSYEKWDKISTILEDTYNAMDKNDKEDLMEDIAKAIEEYEIKLEQERRKTVIHKIAVDKEKIDYVTKGEVNGYLLNQFSMDESGDYFRVATTSYIYARESTMYNNVYVLDENLKVVGQIEDIAPDEQIYSTRFLGNRLYMVTFKRVDPLFVIDLSDPEDPKILGKLKIPGYSDYLHPYDENHIIGIGKETEGNEWGGVSTKGVKLALFDVTDVENPKELDKYEIGDSGSDSEALHEHKAFLFDKKKNLLVIPVREVKSDRVYDQKYGYYRQNIWQGAYVFDLTVDGGFKLKGKISHNEGNEYDYWYWESPNAVRRSLFMDDILYTISAKKVMMNDLENDLEEVNTVKLPYKEQRDYPYPIMY
jgi:uncharacterized secreted protein with C-terminal beta-propeller domain